MRCRLGGILRVLGEADVDEPAGWCGENKRGCVFVGRLITLTKGQLNSHDLPEMAIALNQKRRCHIPKRSLS